MKAFYLTLTCLLAINLSQGQTYKFFAGNLHAHTAYSDGNKDRETTGVSTPTGSYKFAKESAHFHFLGISEHNHKRAGMKDKANYKKGLKEAKDATTPDFVCLYGMEFGAQTKLAGHVLIFGVNDLLGWEENNYDEECGRNDYTHLWEIIAGHPRAFATLAHPKPTDYENLVNSPYNQLADKAIVGVAVMNGPHTATNIDYRTPAPVKYTSYYKKMLAAGYHVGPTVDHDNHNLTFGRMASSRTMVLAESLTPEHIVDAYKKMRFYATMDWNVEVTFEINNMIMGSMFKTVGDANIKVSVHDPDTNDKVSKITVMHGQPGSGKPPKALTTSATNTLAFTHPIPKGQEYYYYLEIIQNDGDKIYTAPVWVYRKKK